MKKWKVILAMVGIFAAGAVTGAVLAAKAIQKVAERNLSPERWPASLVENYKRRLDLTPEQIEKMRPVVEEARREWRATMGAAIRGYAGIVQRLDQELTPLLTPEQLEKHQQLREEMRKRYFDKIKGNPNSSE